MERPRRGGLVRLSGAGGGLLVNGSITGRRWAAGRPWPEPGSAAYGRGATGRDSGDRHRRLAAYRAKYDWDTFATDQGVADSSGAAGPAYRVRPRVVFGWDTDLRTATRWSFAGSATAVAR